MVISTRRNERSVSPQSSSTSSGSSSTSSSTSSSSSSSSSSDSSSETEQSSAMSTRASSESERDSGLASRRGPKASASSVPRKSVPANSSQRKTVPSMSASKPVKGRSEPAPKSQSSQSISSRRSSHTSPKSNKKGHSVSKETAVEEKSKKKKSLFSPDNSSETEPDTSKSFSRKSTTKQLPVKEKSRKIEISAKVSPSKRLSREKLSEKSSESSSNSASSGSDSETAAEVPIASEKKGRPVPKKLDPRLISPKASRSIADEDDKGSASRRFITRSSSVNTKRSALLGGPPPKGTDSESENGKAEKKKKLNFGSRAQGQPQSSSKAYNGGLDRPSQDDSYGDPPEETKMSRPSGAKGLSSREMVARSPEPPIELRNCPVEGCNSTGHLGGVHDRHFTVDACPIFHNLTFEECKVNRDIRKKDAEERKNWRAQMNARSPQNSPTNEQDNYCNKIRESRDRMSEISREDDDASDSDRQPSLRGLTPEWDLKLFQQAQAVASEKTEDEMRGLPDTKGIRYIQMGKFEMEAWYQSQYPEDYNQQPKIYVCEFCLKYMRSRTILIRHAAKCVWRHPPGDEIYRKDKLSVWEVDGSKYKTFCQNLCLLAMLFLDHKTLYYDVEPFLFYIMTIGDSEGCHIIGYFSKEKNSFLNYNVSCIMTLPPYQRQGFGRLLIDFSYILTKEEGKIGSPEKPLSDLGLISYRSYWKDLLLKWLNNYNLKNVSIKDISSEMAVSSYDIVSTFQAMGMMKYWKGKHILLKRHDLFEDFQERQKKRKFEQRELDPNFLDWTPYVSPPQAEDSRNVNNNSINSNNNAAGGGNGASKISGEK